MIVDFYFQTYSIYNGPQQLILFKLPAPGAGAGGGAEAAHPAADVPPAGPHDLLETILVHQHLPRRKLRLRMSECKKMFVPQLGGKGFRVITLRECCGGTNSE